ncbi:MAG: JAB domain-containing protein [Clostridia bacterium]
MIHDNHRERMRDRIEQFGIETLCDHEILEYLLYPFIPRKDTNPIGHELLEKCGSLEGVFNSDIDFLESFANMTHNAAVFLASLSGIYKHYELSKFGKKPQLATFSQITAYAKALFVEYKDEHIIMLAVDNDGNLAEKCVLGNGSFDNCKVNIRKLVLSTQNAKAPNIYLVHNHPSGNVTPSLDDREFTKWAVMALDMLGIFLVDHIIVGQNQLYSFAKDGKLDEFRKGCKSFMEQMEISDTFRR